MAGVSENHSIERLLSVNIYQLVLVEYIHHWGDDRCNCYASSEISKPLPATCSSTGPRATLCETGDMVATVTVPKPVCRQCCPQHLVMADEYIASEFRRYTYMAKDYHVLW